MIGNFTPLISAAGFGELVGLIFVMVSVIGYIIKNVQGNNQQLPPPVQRPGKRREERGADDLDAFLQQVNRQSQTPPESQVNQQQRPNQGQTARGGNNRQRQGAGGQSSGGQRPQSKPAQRQQGGQPPRRLVDDTATRREAAGLGNPKVETVAQHVREHMAERIAKEAQRDVGQDIKESVLHNMGTGLLAPAETGTGENVRKTAKQLFAKEKGTAAECCAANRMESLRKMLCNPESIRQAIVIQEILNRPKCLR